MPIKFDLVFADMQKEMISCFIDDFGDLEYSLDNDIQQILDKHKAKLQHYAEKRVSEQISTEEFDSILQDEKASLQIELQILKASTEVVAEKAANKAINIYFKAVQHQLR